MTVSPQQVPAGDGALRGFAEASYAVARQALADAEPLACYRGIARLSGHLAVMRRLLCQAAVRRLAPDPSLPAAYLADARRAEWALRLLEMRLAGDGCAARVTICVPVPRLLGSRARHDGLTARRRPAAALSGTPAGRLPRSVSLRRAGW